MMRLFAPYTYIYVICAICGRLHFLMSSTMIFSAMSKNTIFALAFCVINRLLSSKRSDMSMMFASLMNRAKFLAKFSSSCVIYDSSGWRKLYMKLSRSMCMK